MFTRFRPISCAFAFACLSGIARIATSRAMQASPMVPLILIPLGLAVAPVPAHEIGTPAWAIETATLRTGPGSNYPAASGTVTAGQALRVTRCTRRWCTIDGSTGWLSMDDLSFGQTPTDYFAAPQPVIARGGPGEVCFHDAENYMGQTICLPSGAVARDLSLLGWDNRIASVSVSGTVSVNLCRDRDFASLCTLITRSTPRLERLLTRAASSYQVW
ncbi:MAG TPA: SH3 domain-containing protein [Devosia sp.]|nr:SH3 domain-containing protein [Devosia sp.]